MSIDSINELSIELRDTQTQLAAAVAENESWRARIDELAKQYNINVSLLVEANQAIKERDEKIEALQAAISCQDKQIAWIREAASQHLHTLLTALCEAQRKQKTGNKEGKDNE